MKALVTGGNGFIGSVLVEKLLDHDIQVKCLVRKTSNLQWIEHLDIELCYGELTEPDSLKDAVTDVDFIFHLAGRTRGLTQADYTAGNYTATLNLLKAARSFVPHLKKFIYISSQAAAGPAVNNIPSTEKDKPNPVSAYGRSKQAAEEQVEKYREFFPTTIIRPPSVYGPRDKDFYIMFQNAVKGLIPIAGNANQKISIVHVDDLVAGILLAAEGNSNGIFFISGDEDCTWLELADYVREAINKKAINFIIPVFIVKIALVFAKLYSKITHKALLLNEDKVNEMQQDAWLCSNEKAKALLSFTPKINLKKGVAETARWYKENGWL